MIGKQNIPKITYNSKDISKDIANFLLSLSYTDPMNNKADDISITVEDSLKLWCGDWFPEKGAQLEVSIISKLDTKEEEYPLGKFEVDEIEFAGMPSTANIKAVSIPDSTALRGVEKNRAWEKFTLSKIAQDIATTTGMQLVYSADNDPMIERAEMSEQSYLSFLQKLCDDNGMALKISNMNIAIFEEYKYEQEEAKISIDFSFLQERIKSYNFRTKIRDVYKSCHVKYEDSSTKEVYEATFTAPDKQEGQTLEVNKQVTSIAEAERLAKQELRNKNKDETTAEIELETAVFYYAAQTVNIKNKGHFDGKYIITQVNYDISSGMKVRLSLRKCLDGY